MNKNIYLSWIVIVILFLSIVIFWFYRIDYLPGLHGDEAWFGLKAVEFIEDGIQSPYGMRNYTGILQSYIASIIFTHFDVGIFQLRVGGLIINVISLFILSSYFAFRVNIKSAILLLLFFSQSTLYLTYPKIAWEVNSFNLFFVVIFIISSVELSWNKGYLNSLWNMIFLSSSFLGSYNHILFSCLPLSVFFGLVIWMLFRNNYNYVFFASLLFINCVNILILYLLTQTVLDSVWTYLGNWLFLIVFSFLAIESIYLRQLGNLVSCRLTKLFNYIRLSKAALSHIFIFCVIMFLIFHGILFWQITTHDVLFLRLYSYELPLWMHIVLAILGSIILLYLIVCLIIDIIKNPEQPWAFIIITYLGFFNLYTTGTSIRYHLTVLVLIFIYMSYRLAYDQIPDKALKGIIATLFLSSVLIQPTLWMLSNDNNRQFKALRFHLGYGRIETSAHFIPFDPVISFLKKNAAGTINTDEKFFIGNNFRFYQLMMPEFSAYQGIARIEYDYDYYGDGFRKEIIQ